MLVFHRNPQHSHSWRTISGGRVCCVLAAVGVWIWITSPVLHSAEFSSEQIEFFETSVRPLLVKHCYECHGDGESESGLRLTSRAAILAGGDSGPAAVAGKLDESLLIEAVRYRGLEMPPQGKLPAEDIKAFERWVELGLPWPADESAAAPATLEKDKFVITDEQRAFWSFQPIQRYEPPATEQSDWPRNDVDRFILGKLEQNDLAPSSAAGRRTLLRRVTYDLIGLPPTPDEMRTFLADESPDAWERVVDRLLTSPQYGERWGRHWLDVVRYADTAGDVADYPVPQAYRYRDYVIAAFNSDKPYDEFIREQLAGDILANSAPKERFAELTTATGYIAVTRRFGYNRIHQHHLTIGDTLDVLGKSLLGLSIGCARCHDHKFDPISAADYYALYGFFASTTYPFPGAEEHNRPLDFPSLLPPTETEAAEAQRAAELAPLDAELQMRAEEIASLNARIAAEGDGAGEMKAAIDKLTADQAATQARRNELTAKPTVPTAYAVSDGTPVNGIVHLRGEPERLGPEVSRRFLEVLGGAPLPPDAVGSGRLELAEWIASPANPLTARVMVNRVWQHHFGRGLVRTPSDFGLRGEPPTHPELLDFLASDFMSNGWSIKRLHKLIVLSNAYQMSSADQPDARRIDPQNNWCWRFEPQRLDAECIRDAMLAVSGQLDPTPGEAHPFPPTETWTFNVHHPFKANYDTNRRSVYQMTQRIQRHPILGLFDGADAGATTDVRILTTTPSQALFLMNDPFVHEQSVHLAQRLQSIDSAPRNQLAAAFELAFSRSPEQSELEAALQFQEQYRDHLAASGIEEAQRGSQALAAYLRTILASNEFIYID